MKPRTRQVLRSIREHAARFVSIMLIVAIGSGFMAGLMAAAPDMFMTVSRYLEDTAFYDLDLKSFCGFTPDDLESVRSISGVKCVQAVNTADLVLEDAHENTFTSRLYGLYDAKGNTELVRAVLREGRLPQKAGECAVYACLAQYEAHAPSVGEHLFLPSGTSCRLQELEIVGLVESPMSVSLVTESTLAGSGSVELDVFVTRDLFPEETYTDLYVTLDGTEDLDTFSESYRARRASVIPEISQLGRDRTRKAREERLGALDALTGHLEKIQHTELEMAAQARESAAELTDTAGRLPEGALRQALTSLAARNIPDPPDSVSRLSTLSALRSRLPEGWTIRTRDDLNGLNSYRSNVEKVTALARIFPVFFFFVALLVAMTTMSRLVEENRLTAGTLKALGYGPRSILGEYLLYALLFAVPGAVLGVAVGFRLFPAAVSAAYSMMYTLPSTLTPFRWDLFLLVSPATVLGIVCAAVSSVRSLTRETPARLMTPPAPAPGRRIFLEALPFVWNRLGFFSKVTCRNLFRYKKRFFMTVIGVAGCSALLVTGFGLRDSVNDIVDRQYSQLSLYQIAAELLDADAPDKDMSLRDLLADTDMIPAFTAVHTERGFITGASRSGISLTVPADPEMYPQFSVLRSRLTHEACDPDAGLVITEKFAEQAGIHPGDSVTIENADGILAQAVVSGIAENYLAASCTLSPGLYRRLFGREIEYNSLLLKLAPGASETEILNRLLACPQVLYAVGTENLRTNFARSMKSIDSVVLVLILAAGLLCVVVLHTLIYVNLCERRKEIATIEVLGFRRREVEQYLFRETTALSLIGALLGLALGRVLHSYVVRTVEIDQVMFGRDIRLSSYLLALGISMLFTACVNQLMKRHIHSVHMAEALKVMD